MYTQKILVCKQNKSGSLIIVDSAFLVIDDNQVTYKGQSYTVEQNYSYGLIIVIED